MEDLDSILLRDYGLKPQGKSAPMSWTKPSPGVGSSRGSGLSGKMSGDASTFGGQEDVPYFEKNGSNKKSPRSPYGGGGDDILSSGNYDDVFGGPPKSSGAGPRYFREAPDSGRVPVYDDLLGGLGVSESKGKGPSPLVRSPPQADRSNFAASESAAFDELLPGFSSEPAKSSASGEAVISHNEYPFVPPLLDDPLSTTADNANSAPFIDPTDVVTFPPIITSTDAPRASSNESGAFDAFDIFDGFPSQPSVDASKPQESSQSSRDDLKKFVENLSSNHSTGTREQRPADENEPSERDLPTVEPTEAGDVKEKWFTVNDVKLVTKPSSIPHPTRPLPVPGSGRSGSRYERHVRRDNNVERSGQASPWPSANTVSAAYANSSEGEQTRGPRKDFLGTMDYKTNVVNHSGDEKDVEEDAAAARAREKERQEKERQEREAKKAKAREQKAQKALEEMEKREAEMQREQAEKHRAADQLDAEIKRWAAGKERNLRALLSTLQYVLWPDCGWQPVSLSDLITAGSVKKTYRKANLVVHPDKVQQKGATVQHKYIAEKVFDLLKEAWNKFQSEQLF